MADKVVQLKQKTDNGYDNLYPDIPNFCEQYLWEKTLITYHEGQIKYISGRSEGSSINQQSSPVLTFYYGDSFTIDESGYHLVNQQVLQLSTWNANQDILIGHYFTNDYIKAFGYELVYLPSEAYFEYGSKWITAYTTNTTDPIRQYSAPYSTKEIEKYLLSYTDNTYPPLEPDGYEYVFKGKLRQQGVIWGSYQGTGIYGSEENANTIIFQRPVSYVRICFIDHGGYQEICNPIDYTSNTYNREYSAQFVLDALSTEYTQQDENSFIRSRYVTPYSKRNSDNTTISWYVLEQSVHYGAQTQGNELGSMYYYYAF